MTLLFSLIWFFPEFEREVERVTKAQGSSAVLSAGFSASLLFQRMASSVRPLPAMIRAVASIQQAGERTCRELENF